MGRNSTLSSTNYSKAVKYGTQSFIRHCWVLVAWSNCFTKFFNARKCQTNAVLLQHQFADSVFIAHTVLHLKWQIAGLAMHSKSSLHDLAQCRQFVCLCSFAWLWDRWARPYVVSVCITATVSKRNSSFVIAFECPLFRLCHSGYSGKYTDPFRRISISNIFRIWFCYYFSNQ